MYYQSTYPAMVFPLLDHSRPGVFLLDRAQVARALAPGLGAVTSGQLVTAGSTTATAVVGATLAPSIAATLGLTLAATIPLIGAAIAALGFGIEAIINSGCGQPCVVTTTWANQAEQALQQNITEYFAIAPPRPASVQAAALANFTTIWNSLVQQCNSPSLGQPGQACISDRQAGACHWTQPASSVPPWGTPAAGECWNWWNGYHDPIANDPDVVADTPAQSVSSAVSSVSSDLGSYALPAAIIGGALLLYTVL